jgi:peptidyl-prolyl cis-trans isomerase NIMA-interacting 1
MSNSKNLPYYFNPKSQESRWEPPDDADIDKLKVYMAKNYTTSGINPKAANGHGAGGDKIHCAHLLVKHRESRRPTSWRESKITRTKEEARQILEGYLKRIEKGELLMTLATSESDCGSARKKGDL